MNKLLFPKRFFYALLTVAFFVAVGVILLGTNMQRGVSHDQHQFVVSGKLLQTKGLLPYKDYVHNHLPNLIFIYAALFKFTEHLVFSARLFSVTCSVLLLGILFWYVSGVFKKNSCLSRFLLGSASVVLLVTDQLFMKTSGRMWNHDLSMLLVITALVFQVRASKTKRVTIYVVLSGILLGLGTGTRTTCAAFLLPFVLSILFLPGIKAFQEKLKLIVLFLLGFFVALLPSFILFLMAPENFVFGNIAFRQLNIEYFQEMGSLPAGNFLYWIPGKLRDIADIFIHRSPIVALAFIICLFPTRSTTSFFRKRRSFELSFLLILIVFAMASGFLSTPSHAQYYYPAIVFMVIASLEGLAFWQNDKKPKLRLQLLTCLLVLAALSFCKTTYTNIGILASRQNWEAQKVHDQGVRVARLTSKGKVLTLAPIIPLEGGAEIYPEFVNGPFVWSIGHLMSEDYRERTRVVVGKDLETWLRGDPPAGILVGYEGDEEKPLEQYARQHGYTPVELPERKILWVPRK
ncbi:MAG: hypothetical protein GY845_13900 [Planctomycetes bacterium]|nr:hypothetical protein [Planctomycetota bacterium]